MHGTPWFIAKTLQRLTSTRPLIQELPKLKYSQYRMIRLPHGGDIVYVHSKPPGFDVFAG